VQLDVNILEIEPQNNPIHTSKIELSSSLGIVMKYPKMSFMNNMDSKDEFDAILNIIVDCIDYIYDEDNVYYAKDTDRKELVEFVESLQSKDLDKIKQFFDTMPKLKKKMDFKCNKCGYHENIELEGIQSFFG
jgi:DNA-directed RNA polymerase subunit M/transcription elongation factor TFIIS